jgi:hypothetical protein
MYTTLCLRSRDCLDDLCYAFGEFTVAGLVDCIEGGYKMAHQRALTTPDLQSYVSTASAPRLRSRTPVDASMERPMTPDGDGGNVKVVVRVRKFIKRGKSFPRSSSPH